MKHLLPARFFPPRVALTFRVAGLSAAILFLATAPAALAARDAEDIEARAKRLHSEVPLVDGHNDLPYQLLRRAGGDLDALDIALDQPELHTDIPRLRESGLGAQIWSAYVAISHERDGTSARRVLQMIDVIYRMAKRYDLLEMAFTADDIERIHREGKIGSLIGIEGGHAIENDLALLRLYYRLGARYMGLTHNLSLPWVEAAVDEENGAGLSAFGKEVIREMNRLGMLVDLAHVSKATMRDAIETSEAPVIFSHSAARELVPHSRNVPDDILKRLPANDGLVMVAFVPGFVNSDSREASVSDVADHIEHIRDIAGIDHVGIGSDFDGIRRTVRDLEDVSSFKNLTIELLDRGWSDEDIRKLLGKNFLRVFRETEATARRLQQERGPSVVQIKDVQEIQE